MCLAAIADGNTGFMGRRDKKLQTTHPESALDGSCPLAQNQYTNNSPGFLSCICGGANAGVACIRTQLDFPQEFVNLQKRVSQNYFPVFTRRLIPQENFLHILVLCRGVTGWVLGRSLIFAVTNDRDARQNPRTGPHPKESWTSGRDLNMSSSPVAHPKDPEKPPTSTAVQQRWFTSKPGVQHQHEPEIPAKTNTQTN